MIKGKKMRKPLRRLKIQEEAELEQELTPDFIDESLHFLDIIDPYRGNQRISPALIRCRKIRLHSKRASRCKQHNCNQNFFHCLHFLFSENNRDSRAAQVELGLRYGFMQ